MENERNESQLPQEENWLENLLAKPAAAEEIGADEQAVSSAGLTHPNDLELEQIMAEILQENEEEKEVAAPQPKEAVLPAASDATQQFTPPQEEKLEVAPAEPVQPPVDKPAPENAPDVSDVPVRKGRPKPKKEYGLLGIPHILSTAIWLVLIVFIGMSLGRMLWVCCADVMAFNKESVQATITITADDNIDTISEKLGDAGLVRYPELFKLFATITGKAEKISAGTFTLHSNLDYNAMINNMGSLSPTREVVTIMFPEGYTCAQIFQLLEKKGVCSVAELEEYAANGTLDDYWFLEGVKRGDKYCLEGYLFPDTYKFYTNDEPRRVLEKFLDTFDYRFTDFLKNKLEPLNKMIASTLSSRGYSQSYINEHKITIREVVIIASMIEKETANPDESYTISSVIYNRLTNPGNYPHLNIDATLIYALGGNIDPETGESKPLTSEDLKMDHPYNTYVNTGLIPGPISNPGRNSLDAALDPTKTSYYFYVYNPKTREHLFAKTKKDHDNNVKYVNSLS